MDEPLSDPSGDLPRGDEPLAPVDPARLEAACGGAQLWGLELDPRYRVLAATLEPTPGASPWELVADRRVQLLCAPVSTILASLRRRGPDGGEVATFELEQLLDISASFGGRPLEPPVFGRPEPRPGEWGPVFSLQGRSSAPDGRGMTATFAVSDEQARLDVFARFDTVEVRDAAGQRLS